MNGGTLHVDAAMHSYASNDHITMNNDNHKEIVQSQIFLKRGLLFVYTPA